jgi:hypothetical protein
MQATQQQKVGEWDKIYSTYWWKGTYLPGQKSEFFKGYSKKYGHNEAADKDYLLIAKVMMLNQHGYLDKCSVIEFHERMGSYCRDTDPVVITLYPDRPVISPEGITKANIYKSLTALYEERKGLGLNKFIHSKPNVINASTDEQVKLSVTKSYVSYDHLVGEMTRLKSIGVADGVIQDAYRKIMDKPFNQNLR